jgi:hypothetical protein
MAPTPQNGLFRTYRLRRLERPGGAPNGGYLRAQVRPLVRQTPEHGGDATEERNGNGIRHPPRTD